MKEEEGEMKDYIFQWDESERIILWKFPCCLWTLHIFEIQFLGIFKRVMWILEVKLIRWSILKEIHSNNLSRKSLNYLFYKFNSLYAVEKKLN